MTFLYIVKSKKNVYTITQTLSTATIDCTQDSNSLYSENNAPYNLQLMIQMFLQNYYCFKYKFQCIKANHVLKNWLLIAYLKNVYMK